MLTQHSFASTLVLGLLWDGLIGVYAQSTDAVCLGNFAWMTNSRGQSPCLVDAYLESECQPDGQWFTPAAQGPSSAYPGPAAQAATTCSCSSVVFSLLSACALCQGASLNSWSSYVTNCSPRNVTNPGYPHLIPRGAAVPPWAYAPVDIAGDKWDPVLAQRIVANGAPDFTASNQPPVQGSFPHALSRTPEATSFRETTTTPPSHPSSTLNSSPSASTIVTPPEAQASSKSFKGALIGGLVGGLCVGLLAIFLVLFFYLRRRPRSAQSLHSTTSKESGQLSRGHREKVDTFHSRDSLDPPCLIPPVSPVSAYFSTQDPFRPPSAVPFSHQGRDEDEEMDTRYFNVPSPAKTSDSGHAV